MEFELRNNVSIKSGDYFQSVNELCKPTVKNDNMNFELNPVLLMMAKPACISLHQLP